MYVCIYIATYYDINLLLSIFVSHWPLKRLQNSFHNSKLWQVTGNCSFNFMNSVSSKQKSSLNFVLSYRFCCFRWHFEKDFQVHLFIKIILPRIIYHFFPDFYVLLILNLLTSNFKSSHQERNILY